MRTTISDIAQRVGWRGVNSKYAEPASLSTLPVVDMTDRTTKRNVRTSVDCYVSGQYVGQKGKSFTITQRYTIFVSYSEKTQLEALTRVREQIVQDFTEKYGDQFNISTVYVPALPGVPEDVSTGAQPMLIYGGTDLAKQLTSRERGRWDIAGERLKAKTNITAIKGRYNLKRNDKK